MIVVFGSEPKRFSIRCKIVRREELPKVLENNLMLAMAYALVVVPLAWLGRPIRMVNPF
jgi:hypothetical protein